MTTERWTYAGKHLDTGKGRLLDLWFATDEMTTVNLNSDKVRLYSRFGTSHILGGIYEVEVHDNGTISSKTAWTGDYIDRAIKLEMASHDSAARTNHRRLRHEKAEAEKDELDIALAPLVALALKARTRTDRDALIATVLRRMSDAW